MSYLDRFDGYPDGECPPRPMTALERWQEVGYEPTDDMTDDKEENQ
jgi:hypothetical protein